MTPRLPDALLTAQRALAASLLDEALTLLAGAVVTPRPAPVAPVPQPGHAVVWDATTIREALSAFVAREGRPPWRNEWYQAGLAQLPGRATVLRVYGSLPAAYAACGLVWPAAHRGTPHA